jgi:antitoxin ParD1/3/4
MGGRNFSLAPRLSRFIDRAVKRGHHQNASEVVREALRRYEDGMKAEEASTAAIWAVAKEGIAAMSAATTRRSWGA